LAETEPNLIVIITACQLLPVGFLFLSVELVSDQVLSTAFQHPSDFSSEKYINVIFDDEVRPYGEIFKIDFDKIGSKYYIKN